MTHPDSYRLQILYVQINRDAHNFPHFRTYAYHADPDAYFYPASTVKLPLACLALEKLNELHIPGVDKYTRMQIDSAYPWQIPELTDSTSADGYPSIAHFIKKAFLVSDNDAYNRLYQLVGQQAIQQKLHQKGYTTARIIRQFMGLTTAQNRYTNPIRFLDKQGHVLYAQPALYNPDTIPQGKPIPIGQGYIDRAGKLIAEPMDFSMQNQISLYDLVHMLQAILFPESVPAYQRFRLTEEDLRFLYQYLSQFPGETNYPKYDSSIYYDTYVKFFFRDLEHHHLPPGVRVFNKVGWAYGFLTDVSYVADFSHRVEYMLAATLYVNRDGILNDDRYEYEEIGTPFLYQLGQLIYQYELHRHRKHLPDLSRFQVLYERRDAQDTRPLIKEVDN
ncbi:MAG: serine hydrolase [Thermoflavifilum sp.]|nr:serine hydrolase [Thermoflavifilum sp.]